MRTGAPPPAGGQARVAGPWGGQEMGREARVLGLPTEGTSGQKAGQRLRTGFSGQEWGWGQGPIGVTARPDSGQRPWEN